MKKILIFFLSSFISLANLAEGQEPTTQYVFKKIDLKNTAQKFDETIKKLVTKKFEGLDHVRTAVAKVEDDTYHWFYAFLDSDHGHLKLKFLFTKHTADSLLDWEISYENPTSFYLPSLFMFNYSSLFFINRVVYLKIYERIYSDFEDRANLHFFSVKPDLVRKMVLF